MDGNAIDVEVVERNVPKLPNEMALELFTYLPVSTLLNFRLVCKMWAHLASNICQNRRVQINTAALHGNSSEVSAITEASLCPPWSVTTSVNMYSWRGELLFNFQQGQRVSPYQQRRELLTILKTHGHAIRKFISIGRLLEHTFELIGHMPNLEVLSVRSFPFPADPLVQWDTSFDSFLQAVKSKYWYLSNPIAIEPFSANQNRAMAPLLKYLKKFYIDGFGGGQSYLLVEFVRRQPPLQKLHFNNASGSDNNLINYTALLSNINIQNLSIELNYYKNGIKLAEFLVDQKISVRKLAFNIFIPSNPYAGTTYFDPLEDLLNANSETLQKLCIKAFTPNERAAPERVQLRLPPLRSLKFLKLQKDTELKTGKGDQRPMLPAPLNFLFLTEFVIDQFPALKRVEIVNIKGGMAVFRHSVHESVEELILETVNGVPNLVQANWGRVFPNIKKFKSKVNSEGLQYIFCKMDTLIELNVEIELPTQTLPCWHTKVCDDADINSILSGIHNPRAVSQLSDAEIQMAITKRIKPSILDLKDLRHLKLKFSALNLRDEDVIQKPFQDSGAIVSLLQLQPLHTLGLTDVQISDTCVTKLKSRHKSIEIHTTAAPPPGRAPWKIWTKRVFQGRNPVDNTGTSS